ncbi:hypothetical protein EET67_00910 [Pseudaminobacter arsenicus]|uniref:FMN hydroxy acid dehydrogenase domain-containing protein n=1 Tax=Borborobacter arsenicus TaxID=1851146 RepID=A0A432VBE8_9HYPH|nr:hypothetical protein EET67_00910 [Pseudaminobacter arsenicus]
MRLRDALTVDDVRLMAQARMPKVVFDYVDGGVEDEDALAANQMAFRRRVFVPRYPVNVENRIHSTQLFGRQYELSFAFRPRASLRFFDRART